MTDINLEGHTGRVYFAELMVLRTQLLALMYPEGEKGICEGWYDTTIEEDCFHISFPNSGKVFFLTCSVLDED